MLIGMADNNLVGVDHAETPGFDVLFLAECEQHVQELLIGLEHLYELHDAPVRNIQFTIETVSSRVALDSNLAYSGEVNAAYELTDILTIMLYKPICHKRVRPWHEQIVDRLDACRAHLSNCEPEVVLVYQRSKHRTRK